MDFTDSLKAGGASATLIAIITIAYKVIKSTCGHRLKSECCGKTASIGVNVESMNSPKHEQSTLESTTVVVRSARPSLETRVDRSSPVLEPKPAPAGALPADLQARL